MLWYKSWLDTRWRFLIGLAIVGCAAAGVVFTYPHVLRLMPLAAKVEIGGELGRRLREAAQLSREYRGFVWVQGFRQNLTEMTTLFAVLLGTGGLVSQPSGAGALFTLSMPVSRARLLQVRAATGLAELLALAVMPAVVIPLLSPAIGEHYGVGSALVHSVCLFFASSTFFSFAVLLSTLFTDLWRPLLIAIGVAFAIAFVEPFFHDWPYGIYHVMSGEVFFRTGHVPWVGLIITAGVSLGMLYAAARNLARRDF